MSGATELMHCITTSRGLVGLPSGRWWIDAASARRMVGSADAVNAAIRRKQLRADLIDGRKAVDFTDIASRWLLSRPGGTDQVGRYIEQFELLRGEAPAVLITHHDEDQFEAWRLGLTTHEQRPKLRTSRQ